MTAYSTKERKTRSIQASSQTWKKTQLTKSISQCQTSIAVTAFDTGIRALQVSWHHLSTQEHENKQLFWKLCSRCGVEHIDQDETEGDEEDNPGGDDVGGHEEGDPGHGDKHGGGQVDREDEGTQRTRELHLKSVHWVVACKKTSYLFLAWKLWHSLTKYLQKYQATFSEPKALTYICPILLEDPRKTVLGWGRFRISTLKGNVLWFSFLRWNSNCKYKSLKKSDGPKFESISF